MSRTGFLVVVVMFAVVPNQMASAQLCLQDVVGALEGENNCWTAPNGTVNINDLSDSLLDSGS